MAKTLDEWVSINAPDLKADLEENVELFCDEMTQDDKESFVRMNLVMVRQWAQKKGIDVD